MLKKIAKAVASVACATLLLGIPAASAQKLEYKTFVDSVAQRVEPSVCGDLSKARYNIAWPVSGNPQLVKTIKDWIVKHLYGDKTPASYSTPQTFISNFRSEAKSRLGEGLVYDNIDVTINPHPLFKGILLVNFNEESYFCMARFSDYNNDVLMIREEDGALCPLKNFIGDVGKFRPVLVRYLTACDEKVTRRDWNNFIQNATPDDLPLPKSGAYCGSDGVTFSYDLYEVTDGAHCPPSATIPYDVIKPYLSREAQEFFMGPKKAPEAAPQPASESEPEEEEVYVSTDTSPVFTAVEEAAEYPGGASEMYKTISRNLKYPEDAAADSIQGRVMCQFIIEKDGRISEVKVVRGKHPSLDKEAKRVIRTLGRFRPARMNGEPVRSWYTLPINFKLPN